MKKKTQRIISILFFIVMMISIFSLTVFAEGDEGEAKDLFQAADSIIRNVYTKIVGISTVLAGLMSTVSVIGAKMSNNQHKVDQSWDWLKRIWIAWAVINGIGAFIAYISPLFDGYSALP